jgi:CarD family transcriptional regulator
MSPARVVERMRRPEEAGNWSRRYKLNLEKLASKDPASVSEVIVDLELQDREVGLSAGERRMLDRAWTLRQLLSGE